MHLQPERAATPTMRHHAGAISDHLHHQPWVGSAQHQEGRHFLHSRPHSRRPQSSARNQRHLRRSDNKPCANLPRPQHPQEQPPSTPSRLPPRDRQRWRVDGKQPVRTRRPTWGRAKGDGLLRPSPHEIRHPALTWQAGYRSFFYTRHLPLSVPSQPFARLRDAQRCP